MEATRQECVAAIEIEYRTGADGFSLLRTKEPHSMAYIGAYNSIVIQRTPYCFSQALVLKSFIA